MERNWMETYRFINVMLALAAAPLLLTTCNRSGVGNDHWPRDCGYLKLPGGLLGVLAVVCSLMT